MPARRATHARPSPATIGTDDIRETRLLQAFAILLLFQCLGEGIVFLLGLPVPGPVAGMVLLFASLLVWPSLQERMEAAANELLRHLSLLFVPAGVGIVAAAGSGSGHWLAMIASLIASTLATLAVTALFLKLFGSGLDAKADTRDDA